MRSNSSLSESCCSHRRHSSRINLSGSCITCMCLCFSHQYPFGENLEVSLLQPLQASLQTTAHTYCGRSSHLFTKRLKQSVGSVQQDETKKGWQWRSANPRPLMWPKVSVGLEFPRELKELNDSRHEQPFVYKMMEMEKVDVWNLLRNIGKISVQLNHSQVINVFSVATVENDQRPLWPVEILDLLWTKTNFL